MLPRQLCWLAHCLSGRCHHQRRTRSISGPACVHTAWVINMVASSGKHMLQPNVAMAAWKAVTDSPVLAMKSDWWHLALLVNELL